MAFLHRPTATRYVDANGKRCNKTTTGAKKQTTKLRSWYATFTDANGIKRTRKLSSNKTAAKQMLAQIEQQVEREKAGLTSPHERQHKRILSEHLADFRQSITDKAARWNMPIVSTNVQWPSSTVAISDTSTTFQQVVCKTGWLN